ncbi:MAG TPA: transcriptional regulator [Anaerolineaceae bacterium]|nr:transcriptional regulator [Anaerolineaceae bacterium]
MEELKPFIPYLIPVIIIQLGLMVFALVDLVRRERTKGPKWMWALIIVAVNIIGPVVYLLAGKDES